jgi:omega-3 fatty acid desaturase (delta-15 desaturase)
MDADISKIKSIIPKKCFEKNLLKSMTYFMINFGLLITSLLIYKYINYWYEYLLYWNVFGFIAWGLFVIGHDCGHGSFSNYPIINNIFGTIAHSIIFVPYYPWKRSHYYHHLYHNHKDNDKSHPWLTNKEFKDYPYISRKLLPSIIGPVIGFWVYLYYGIDRDGCHIIPFGKLYKNTSIKQKLECVSSVICIIMWYLFLYWYFGSNYDIFINYGMINIVCFYWLFCVTYFQHHIENTTVYTSDNFSFINGAFETVDRKIGYKIDDMHYNITDCHIVHHLFFKDIPHYHLTEANNSMRNIPELNKRMKFVDHSHYPSKYFVDFNKYYSEHLFTNWKYKTDSK